MHGYASNRCRSSYPEGKAHITIVVVPPFPSFSLLNLDPMELQLRGRTFKMMRILSTPTPPPSTPGCCGPIQAGSDAVAGKESSFVWRVWIVMLLCMSTESFQTRHPTVLQKKNLLCVPEHLRSILVNSIVYFPIVCPLFLLFAYPSRFSYATYVCSSKKKNVNENYLAIMWIQRWAKKKETENKCKLGTGACLPRARQAHNTGAAAGRSSCTITETYHGCEDRLLYAFCCHCMAAPATRWAK